MPDDPDSGQRAGDIPNFAISLDDDTRAAQLKLLMRVRAALQNAMAALDDAAELLQQAVAPPQPETPAEVVASDVEAIKGKALRHALVVLAERHDGMLRSKRARQTLQAAGISITPGRLWKQIAVTRRFKTGRSRHVQAAT